VLLHNGKEASYLNFVSDNDEIVIKWDSDIWTIKSKEILWI
jgi:hypothetical protein